MSILVTSLDMLEPIRVKLSTTAITAVYTCPKSMSAKVVVLRLVNTDAANPVNVTVSITDSTAVTYVYYQTTALAASAHIEFDVQHSLTEGETINVQASSVDDIHVIGAVLEARHGHG